MHYHRSEERSIATALSAWKPILAERKKDKYENVTYFDVELQPKSSQHNETERKGAAFYRDFTFNSLNGFKISIHLDKM